MYTKKNIFEKVDCIDKSIVFLSEISKDIKKSLNNDDRELMILAEIFIVAVWKYA